MRKILILILLAACGLMPRRALAERTSERPPGWAIVYAPDAYQSLQPAEFLARGGNEVAAQLQAAGFPPERLVVIHRQGSATTDQLRRAVARVADRAQRDEVFLVVAACHAMQLQGKDMLCGSDTTAADLHRAATTNDKLNRLLPVQELLQQMRISASQKRCLILDAAGSHPPLPPKEINAMPPRYAADFLCRGWELPQGEWIIGNRGGRLRKDDQGHSSTHFLWSVKQALAGYANQDRDQHVSVFELSEYLQHSAEAEGLTPPLLLGRTAVDFPLSNASRPTAPTTPLTRRMNAIRLGTAGVALLLEQQPETATQLLSRLDTTGEPATRAQVEAWRQLARAHSQRPELPLKAPVFLQVREATRTQSRPFGVWNGVRTRSAQILGQLPAGSLVRATRWESDWIYFDTALQLREQNGQLQLVKLEQPPAWFPAKQLGSASAESNALAKNLKGLTAPAR